MDSQARYQLTPTFQAKNILEYHFGVHKIFHVRYDAVIAL
jgi:hypothetical protein